MYGLERHLMKYMGHKGKLLSFLGDLLVEEASDANAIADPFCGSGAVSWYLAQNTKKAIMSGDLQKFAVCRAASVVERTEPVSAAAIFRPWIKRATSLVKVVVDKFPNAEASVEPNSKATGDIISLVIRSRVFCETVLPNLLESLASQFPMTKAYGGHYFSPMQALMLDALRATLPRVPDNRSVALAALIETASRCAAAPGHTAQPFQPTATSAIHIMEAWQRPVEKLLFEAIETISSRCAGKIGAARVMDFGETINSLEEGDLVFADPPYSDVHYSRFYHVLETLAHGREVEVSGRGRYPEISKRPSSRFSLRSQSEQAARDLIIGCHSRKLNLVLTFPSGEASNGLSAESFMSFAKGLYSSIEEHKVDSDFSTLGGNAKSRGARLKCQESIICFRV
ncbi:DNA adenine methylase [Pseudomonas sp. Marseille-Q5117]|uniref:DNA adenine methylase n=1 Tax=Pseudomonas sp. Marseille-Q5117 TaxID=2972777 RepID=UPI0021C6389C|nr:DNA adenine methylase [Pseudomonas sp. Marseille-Q5117]